MTAPPAVLGPLREQLVADAEGVNAHRRPNQRLHWGEEGQVRRSPQAMAGRKRDGEALGRPHRRRRGGRVGAWETAREARAGTPGHGTLPAPQRRRGTRTRQAEADGARASPPEARGESSPAEDAARGKAPSRGQAWPAGRRPPRPLAPATVGSEARTPTARRGRTAQATADQPHRWRDRSRDRNVARRVDCWGDLEQEAARWGLA